MCLDAHLMLQTVLPFAILHEQTGHFLWKCAKSGVNFGTPQSQYSISAILPPFEIFNRPIHETAIADKA